MMIVRHFLINYRILDTMMLQPHITVWTNGCINIQEGGNRITVIAVRRCASLQCTRTSHSQYLAPFPSLRPTMCHYICASHRGMPRSPHRMVTAATEGWLRRTVESRAAWSSLPMSSAPPVALRSQLFASANGNYGDSSGVNWGRGITLS